MVMIFRPVVFLLLSYLVGAHAAAQELTDPWKALPDTTAYELKMTFRAILISSDAVTLSDARTALITYWRGGPADTYYRCVDYEDADFQSTGHFCWQLDSQ